MNLSHRAPLRAVLFPLAGLVLAGCGRPEIRSYRIAKEETEAQPPPAAAPAGEEPAASAAPAEVSWTAPAAWKAKPPSALRQASFDAAGPDGTVADVSVISFPGSGGDDLANVNRWRGQMGLPPIGPESLAGQVHALEAPAGHLVVVDLAGSGPGAPGPQRMIGAWLREPAQTWFFKIIGPGPAVAAQADAFSSFLKSITGSPPAPQAAGALPPGHPALAGGPADPAAFQVAQSGGSLSWQAPAQWRAGPASAMRKGTYLLGSDGTATLAISAFPGDVGGVAANVNRWRGQVGLPALSDADALAATQTISVHGLKVVVADAAAPGGPRILAALVPFQGATWFFKVSGPSEAVGRAKSDFLQFLQTIQSP